MRPYHEAYAVRMLTYGATCRFIVPELDAGNQIIYQSTFTMPPGMKLDEIMRRGEHDNEPHYLVEGVRRVVAGEVKLDFHRVVAGQGSGGGVRGSEKLGGTKVKDPQPMTGRQSWLRQAGRVHYRTEEPAMHLDFDPERNRQETLERLSREIQAGIDQLKRREGHDAEEVFEELLRDLPDPEESAA